MIEFEESDCESDDEDYVPENEEPVSEDEDDEICETTQSDLEASEQPTDEQEKKRGDQLWNGKIYEMKCI